MKNLFVKKNLIDCMCVFSKGLRQNNHELPLTCIANASSSLLTCPLFASLSLVSRQSDLDTYAAGKTNNASGARVAQEWLKYAAVLLLLLTLEIGNAWGADYSFVSSTPSGWTASPTPNGYENSDLTRGANWTSNFSLTFAGVSNVTEIVITYSTNNAQTGFSVTVGGVSWGGAVQALASGDRHATKTFSGSAASGDIVISCTRTNKTIYVEKISITTGGGSSCTECTYYVYNGTTWVSIGTTGFTDVVLAPPTLPDNIHGAGNGMWCTNKNKFSSCISYVNSNDGDYRFVPNPGGADPDDDNKPGSGTCELYAVYWDGSCLSTTVTAVQCARIWEEPEPSTPSVSGSNVTLSWSSVTGASGYHLYVTDGDSYEFEGDVNSTSKTLSGLAAGTYSWTVAANSSDDDACDSNSADGDDFEIVGCTDISSSTVTGVSVTPSKVGGSATWTAVANATSYEVKVYAGTATSGVTLFSAEPTSNSCTITGLSASTQYTVVVKAKNSCSTSNQGTATWTTSALTLYTVTFHNAAGSAPSAVTQTTEGGTVSIPSASACEGWTFVGWKVGSTQSSTTTDPTSSGTWITNATWPKSYTPTGNIDVYAVFSQTVGGGSGAAANTVLWSEDFSGYSANAVPSETISSSDSHTGTIVYSGSVTYACTDGTNGTTKIYDENTAGGTSPELMVSKYSGTFEITGIPKAGATAVTVSFTTNNQNMTVASSTTGYTGSYSQKAAGTHSFDITCGSASTFTLTFTGPSGNNNIRLDDIVVKVKTAGASGTTTWTSSPDCGSTKELTSITIDTDPTRLNYVTGEFFDPTGAVVTAHYDDSSTETVTGSTSWDPETALTEGTSKTATASYTEGGITKTATVTINVYTPTVLKKDETGATISGLLSDAPAVSCTVATLSAAATGNQYTFKEWQISGGTLGSAASEASNSIATVTGAVTVTAVYYKPITVTWHVNGSVFSGPSQHAYGWEVLFPDPAPTPASVGCEGKIFIGWTRTENYRSADTPPTLVASHEVINDATSHFYAVFADKEVDGSAPEWTKTALSSASPGTYLICTPGGYAFTGTFSSGDGTKTSSAFSSGSWANNVFNEDAPVGAQEITITEPSTGQFKMNVAGSGYITAKKAARGGLQYEVSDSYYWMAQNVGGTYYWKYSHDFGSSTYAFFQANSNTDFRNYNTSSTGNPIILLKKTAAGVPAVYSDYTTSCTCKGFSFHTGSGTDEAVKTTNTRTCFTQVGSSTTWQIEDYVIPSDAKFFVGWQDEFKSSGLGSSSRSAVTQFDADEALYFEYTKNYGDGYRPSVGNAVGAIGTLRIWSDNSWNNCHVGFDPNGYIFKLGSTYYTMSNSATLDGARYKETEVITLTSSDISGQFQVNIAAVAPNVSTGVASRYTESKNLTTMGVKSGATTWRGDGVKASDANTRGFFRIDKGEGNATNWNAHWVPVWEITFDLKGGTGTIVTTPEYVSVEAASKVVTIPNTVPTKDGYRFMGWSDDDNNTVEYAAGSTHNVTLSGNKTVYAVWKQEFTVTYNYAGGSADPACAGGTFVAGETVTVCTTTPTKTASTFNGWSYSPSVTVTAGQFTMPESNVVVTATWIDTEYTLTHNGTNYTNTEDKTSIKSGDTPFDLHYTCTGTYAFPNSISITGGGKSWTMGTDYTWVVAGDKQSATLHINESIISANVTIEITMQTRCTITYTIPTGGGSCATEPTTAVLSGETVTLPNVTGISSAYSCETFLGWTTTAPNVSGTWASTPSYKAAGATSDAINSDVTFYAVYSRPGAGASGTVELTCTDVGNWWTVTLNSTKNSYGTVTHHTAADGSTWYTDGQIQGAACVDLKAADNRYIQIPTTPGTISSIEMQVSQSTASNTAACGTGNATEHPIAFRTTASGSNVFTGTSSDHSCTINISSGDYYTGYIVNTDGTTNIHSVTVNYGPAPIVSHSLYCGCEVAEFDLTYDANTTNYPGSTITPCTGVTDYKWSEHDDKYTICSTTPTCDGYKFIGWNTQANGSGEGGYLYQPDEEVSCWGEASVTLYAQYERVYTVTFDNQGVTTPVTQASEGAAIDVPDATTACSSDWAFVGWSETAIAPKSLMPALEIAAGTSTYTPTEDKTLYAIYRKTSTSSAFVAGMSGAYKISNGGDVYAGAATGKLAETNAAGAVTYYITYTAADGGKYTIQRNDGKYIAYSGSSTDLSVSDAAYYWTMTKKGSLWHVFATTSTDRYLQYSSGTGFKAYNFSTTTDIAFVAAEGQYYYRTMSCEDDFDITFHNNGTTINWAAGYPEASYKDLADATVISTFPTATFDGWTFLGWRSADYTESTTAPASSGIYGGTDGTSGNTLTIASANVDLYPVFTKFDDNDPFDQINGGDYYIYFRQTGSDDGYGGENRVYAATYDGEKRYNSAALCSGATEFTFTKLANGKWTILDKTTNKYLYASDATTDNLKQSTTAYEWTITVRSGNQFDAICEGQTYGQLIAQGDGTSATFMSYRITNIETNPGVYHPVYLGSCTNRTFTTNPSTTPNIELHGQVKVTSTASKSIKATSVLTVSASNIATANLTVTSDNSAFKFSLTSNGTYTASVNIPVVSNKVGVTPIYVEYTPTATTDGIEEATITVSDGASPTPTTATTSAGDVQGRHVPANFVIAAKWGDKWYALPANCTESTSSTTGALIEVDNASDPTTATYAPSYTKWGLQTVRPSRKAEYGTRLVFTEQLTTATADDQKTLYNGSTTNIQANAMYKYYMNSNPDNYEWIPTTTDLKDYILTSATTLGGDASARTVSLSNKGVFGTLLNNKAYDGKVRLLPATFVEPAEIQVVEWKASSVVVMYTGSGTKAITQLGDDAPSSAQSLASAKIDHGVFELTTGTLTSAKNEPLNITIQNGSDAIVGRKSLVVPAIVSGSQNAPLGLETDETKLTDVVILDGATLSAAATKYTFKNITVYPGGKLVIGGGKQMGMASLTLRGGSSWGAATYEHKYPQFVVNNTTSGAYSNSSAVINYDYVTTKDQYYSFVLPYASNTKNIKYPVDIYGSNVSASNTGSFEFQYYDGEARAAGGTGWAVLAEDPSTGADLVAGTGYTFLGMPKKIYAYDGTETRTNVRQQYGIHRIPMSVAAGAVQSGETTDKNITIAVTLATKNNDSGWNLIGNPYMSNVSGLTNTDIQVGKLVHVNDAGGNWTGRWQWDDTNTTTGVRYIVTTDDGQTFESQQASTATLKAFKNFFVQIQNEGANTLVIPATTRTDKSLAPARYMDEVEQDIQLAVDLVSEARKDKVDLLINDIYTDEFDQDGDFTKMMNSTNFNLYGVYPGDNLSFIAVDKTTAANSIAVGYQVPAGGDYTLQLSDKEYVMTDAIEALYVTDHEVSPEVTTDLLDGPYNFHVNNAETNDTRFTISVRLVPKTPTDLEIVPGEGMEDMKPQKFIYHDKMYILRGGVIYDATGKKVGEINK